MAMREADPNEFGFAEPKNDRRRRGVYLLPGVFTVGNLLCGFYAVLATLQGGVANLDDAARAIGFAILFDTVDGFIARVTRTNTDFGKQFDSLADMVSFAMAPAVLLAQGADWVDLDGPLLLARDRQPALRYEGALVHPPEPRLWG